MANWREIVLSGSNAKLASLEVDTNVQISGSLHLSQSLYDGNNNTGTDGQVLSSTVTGSIWIDAASGAQGDKGQLGENYKAKLQEKKEPKVKLEKKGKLEIKEPKVKLVKKDKLEIKVPKVKQVKKANKVIKVPKAKLVKKVNKVIKALKAKLVKKDHKVQKVLKVQMVILGELHLIIPFQQIQEYPTQVQDLLS